MSFEMTDDITKNMSDTMASNIFTMGICAGKDHRQRIGDPYTIPPRDIRLLRAKLLYEETMETIRGLGVIRLDNGDFIDVGTPDLEQIIDGVCDMDYVGTGTLVSCGVLLDNPHRLEVCVANNRKFPGGIAVFNESGKYQKPKDWVGPDHEQVRLACINEVRAMRINSELSEN